MDVIRPFRNSDTLDLAEAWQQHWQAEGVPVSISTPQIEQSILNKLFFSAEHMFVVERDGKLVGFSHVQSDPSNAPPVRARIASFCIGRVDDRAEVGRRLLADISRSCVEQGIKELEAGTVLGDLSGLVGLEPYAGVIGMIEHDRTVVGLLGEAGFDARTPMLAYECSLSMFRPPMDRELLMLRRSARVDERPGSLPDDWRAACAHSHFDITRFIVSNRASEELSSATYYLADPDAMVMDRGLLYLAGFGDGSESEVDLSPEIRYAVVGSLTTLNERHFKNVRAIIDSRLESADARVSFLEQLGFCRVAVGAAYSRHL